MEEPCIFQHADQDDNIGGRLQAEAEDILLDNGDIREIAGSGAEDSGAARTGLHRHHLARDFSQEARDRAATRANFQHPTTAQRLPKRPQQIPALGREMI
jgi:hypothetical protein